MNIQICSVRIQNTPGTTSTWLLCSYWLIQGEGILLDYSQFGAFVVALVTSWRRQVLLYAHSKHVGSCSMRIQNMARAVLFII
jgi:hypothetical protein